jgi:hypothetical protein
MGCNSSIIKPEILIEQDIKSYVLDRPLLHKHNKQMNVYKYRENTLCYVSKFV